MAERTPCLRRCWTIKATSPNQDGVEGTDWEEAWMITDPSTILVMSTSLFRNSFVLPYQGGMFLSWFATCYNLVAQFVGTSEQHHPDEAERRKHAMSTTGLSKARLVRMHDVMAGYVERGEVPGLVTLVSRRGEVHVDVIGTQALGDSPPMRRDTLFRISSMTKPITAAATMILVEECKLRLDDPVDALLPELAERQVLKRLDGPLDDKVPAKRPFTVRDLLTFRMGFGQMLAPPDAYPILSAASAQQIGMGPPSPSTMPAPDEWMRRLGRLPLMHQPGEQWMYNTGSDVLGVLIARASGQPLETFLRERLFEPLEMRDTSFSVPEASFDRLAN